MIVYCDGACTGNGSDNSYGGFAVVATSETGEILSTYSKGCRRTSNNKEEIKAVLYALICFGKMEPTVTVYSDSAYVVNTFNSWVWSWRKRGWLKSDNKTPENLDLIQAYCELYDKGYRINLRKCAGHSGIPGNELADKMAVAAKEEMKIG